MRRGTPPTIAVAINDITTCAWLVYDALGRRVEQPGTQIVYGIDSGKLALMNHQTVSKAFAPLPAGSAAVYAGSTLAWYRHPDWLGSSWITSLASGTDRRSRDVVYSPFGDIASESGTGTADRNFTGQNQDLSGIFYDFPAREYSQGEGRWISPDPAGLAAVDPANPQSWNRYAYVNNSPLNLIDPTGMDPTQQDIVMRLVEKDGCLYLQNGTRTVWINPDNETTSYTYLWGGMSLLACKPSGTGPHGPGGGGETAPANSRKTCVGRARVLGGNPRTVGRMGGTGVPVAANSAAAIPAQFGFQSGRPFAGPLFYSSPYAGTTGGRIAGSAANLFFADVNLHAGSSTQSFSGITDVIGSSSVADVRNFLIQRNPNALILELVNGSDQGVTTVRLTVPAGQACPAGTLDQNVVNGNYP